MWEQEKLVILFPNFYNLSQFLQEMVARGYQECEFWTSIHGMWKLLQYQSNKGQLWTILDFASVDKSTQWLQIVDLMPHHCCYSGRERSCIFTSASQVWQYFRDARDNSAVCDAFTVVMRVMNHSEWEMVSLHDTPQVLLARFAAMTWSTTS